MKKGFTLLEILLIIAAIGILAAIVIIAINPNRQLAQARDAQRRVDTRTYWSAIEQYTLENSTLPTNVASLNYGERREICASGIDEVTCTNASLVYLEGDLTPTYTADLPRDPQSNGNLSGYYITKGSGNNFLITNYSREIDTNTLQVGNIVSPPFEEDIIGWYGLESEMEFDTNGNVNTWKSINTSSHLESVDVLRNPEYINGQGVNFAGWPAASQDRDHLRVPLENFDAANFSYALVNFRSASGIASGAITWGLDDDLARLNNSNVSSIEFGDTNSGFTLTSILSGSERGIITVGNNSTGGYVRHNGSNIFNTTSATFLPASNTNFNIGESNHAANIRYSEIILYNRSLNELEMGEVESYLSNKWDISI